MRKRQVPILFGRKARIGRLTQSLEAWTREILSRTLSILLAPVIPFWAAIGSLARRSLLPAIITRISSTLSLFLYSTIPFRSTFSLFLRRQHRTQGAEEGVLGGGWWAYFARSAADLPMLSLSDKGASRLHLHGFGFAPPTLRLGQDGLRPPRSVPLLISPPFKF